jgi:hypothetical protein
MAKKKMSPYYPAEDMLKHLQEAKTLKDGIDKFFRHDCEFWDAFRKYIDNCEIGHCPFVDLDHPIHHCRASWGIHLGKIYANPIGAGENAPNVIRVCFSVDMRDEDDRPCGDSGMIDVPIRLITHFKQHEFDEWVGDEEERHKTRRWREAREELEELQAKYPDVLSEEAVSPLLGAIGAVLAVREPNEEES